MAKRRTKNTSKKQAKEKTEIKKVIQYYQKEKSQIQHHQ